MTVRAKLFLASCALAALSLTACGGTEANVTVNSSNAARRANTAAPAASPASTTPASSGAAVIGVAACDEYIALYERCLANPNVPEQIKTAWRTSLEQRRTAWRQADATAEGKAQLATTCQQMLATAKPQLEQYCK